MVQIFFLKERYVVERREEKTRIFSRNQQMFRRTIKASKKLSVISYQKTKVVGNIN